METTVNINLSPENNKVIIKDYLIKKGHDVVDVKFNVADVYDDRDSYRSYQLTNAEVKCNLTV